MATNKSPVSAADAPIVPTKKSCQAKALYQATAKVGHPAKPNRWLSAHPVVPNCPTVPTNCGSTQGGRQNSPNW